MMIKFFSDSWTVQDQKLFTRNTHLRARLNTLNSTMHQKIMNFLSEKNTCTDPWVMSEPGFNDGYSDELAVIFDGSPVLLYDRDGDCVLCVGGDDDLPVTEFVIALNTLLMREGYPALNFLDKR